MSRNRIATSLPPIYVHLSRHDDREDEELRQFIIRRVLSVVRPFASRVDSVSVRLTDINGPRGGIDQRCAITVSTQLGMPIVIQQSDSSPHRAVALAARRAAVAVGRLNQRHHLQKATSLPPWRTASVLDAQDSIGLGC